MRTFPTKRAAEAEVHRQDQLIGKLNAKNKRLLRDSRKGRMLKEQPRKQQA